MKIESIERKVSFPNYSLRCIYDLLHYKILTLSPSDFGIFMRIVVSYPLGVIYTMVLVTRVPLVFRAPL